MSHVPEARSAVATPARSAEDPHSMKRTAHTAGLLYFVMSALMIFGYLYVPAAFIVSGNPAATMQKILAGESMYRMTVLASAVAQILFIFVVLTLYHLFRNVGRRTARLMVALVCVGVSAEFVVIANRISPLHLLDGSSYLAAFSQAQLESMAYHSMVWGTNLAKFITVFWGLWLLPFGLLVIRSGFLPRILGYLLLAAGTGYVITFLADVAAPGSAGMVRRFVSPLYFGEPPIILWLMILGIRAPRVSGSGT